MRYTREDGCRAWLAYGELQPEPLDALLEAFGSCEAAYDSFQAHGPSALKAYASQHQLKLLAQRAEKDAMHEMMRIMQRLEMGILTPEDDRYPDALRNIEYPPRLLFYRGNPDCLSGHCLTMVGTRNPSFSGDSATYRIAKDLSASGVCIVSGLAMGIDTTSLKGGLDGGTPVAGVAACGLDVNYPAMNSALRERILATGGVLLSEYPPGIPALKHHFAVRNRIMSGLSSAVLMMECAIKSGSMLTVDHALDQGKDVYAYSGDTGRHWTEGAHFLLRQGARYFDSAADVLEDMGWSTVEPVKKTVKALPAMQPEQKKVYELLQRGEMSFDALAASSGMDAGSLNGALTMLQLMGLVKALPGKVYKTA